MLRVNGVSFPESLLEGKEEGKGDVEEVETSTASGCCETCMQRQGCLWSIWEASGEKKGSCYLAVLDFSHQGAKGLEQRVEEDGVCTKQEIKGSFGYSSGNGEVGYVVSNGLCGMLLQEA
jgi:hypothetical protein